MPYQFFACFQFRNLKLTRSRLFRDWFFIIRKCPGLVFGSKLPFSLMRFWLLLRESENWKEDEYE